MKRQISGWVVFYERNEGMKMTEKWRVGRVGTKYRDEYRVYCLINTGMPDQEDNWDVRGIFSNAERAQQFADELNAENMRECQP